MQTKQANRYQTAPTRHGGCKRRLAGLLMLVGICLFGLVRLDCSLRPIIEATISRQAEHFLIRTIQQTYHTLLQQQPNLYQNLYEVSYNQAGQVQSIQVNGLAVSQLEDALAEQLTQQLAQSPQMRFYIPLGTLLDIQLFQQSGPDLEIQLVPLTTPQTETVTSFESVGINQSRWELTLDVQLELGALYAGQTMAVRVNSKVLAAQVLIVGQVPQVNVE